MVRVAALAAFALGMSTAAHAQAGKCSDPWINQAYTRVMLRPPVGSGVTGECNKNLYGGGSWNSLDDLEKKIVAYHHPSAPAPKALAPAPAASAGLHLDRSLNLVNASGAIVAPANTFKLVNPSGALLNPSAIVAQGGGNIVAQGGGNIVAQGGGNIVAQGGGNMRSLQSVDSKPVYVVK
jgi:hypothetical protein